MSTGSEAGSGEAIGVVYLARCAEGAPAFRRFADSYRRQPAGRDHQLVVIYKGFVQRRDRLEARAVFDDLPHLGIELDDSGFDIGAYLEASRRVTHDYLCFLNTYSELAVSGWLAKLADHGLRDGVGIAGAMGSYESLFDSILLMRHARWARDYSLGAADSERVGFYYGMLLDRASGNGDGIADAAPAPRLPPAAGRILRYPWYRWKGLARLWPGAQTIDIRQFPSFPNPHLRSNGFIIRREWLRRFDRIRIELEIGRQPVRERQTWLDRGAAPPGAGRDRGRPGRTRLRRARLAIEPDLSPWRAGEFAAVRQPEPQFRCAAGRGAGHLPADELGRLSRSGAA